MESLRPSSVLSTSRQPRNQSLIQHLSLCDSRGWQLLLSFDALEPFLSDRASLGFLTFPKIHHFQVPNNIFCNIFEALNSHYLFDLPTVRAISITLRIDLSVFLPALSTTLATCLISRSNQNIPAALLGHRFFCFQRYHLEKSEIWANAC